MDEQEKFQHSQAIVNDIENIVKHVEVYVCGMLRRDHDNRVDDVIFSKKNDVHKEVLLQSLANQLVSSLETAKCFSELLLKHLKDFMVDYKDALAIGDFEYKSNEPELKTEKIDGDVEAITLAITKKINGEN